MRNNSWVVIDSENKFYFGYDAFLKLLELSLFAKLSVVFQSIFFKKIGCFVYLKISGNRKNYLSFLNYFQFKRPLNYKLRWWTQTFVVVCFVVATFWNVALHSEDDSIELNRPAEVIGAIFRLHQNWVMFAPYPSFEDGWIVTEAILKNGQTWDIFNDQTVTFEKPASVSNMYKNSLWRKYSSNIKSDEYEKYQLYFGRFLCRQWNDRNDGDQQVDNFKIYYMLDRTNKINTPKKPLEKKLLWSHGCFVK